MLEEIKKYRITFKNTYGKTFSYLECSGIRTPPCAMMCYIRSDPSRIFTTNVTSSDVQKVLAKFSKSYFRNIPFKFISFSCHNMWNLRFVLWLSVGRFTQIEYKLGVFTRTRQNFFDYCHIFVFFIPSMPLLNITTKNVITRNTTATSKITDVN